MAKSGSSVTRRQNVNFKELSWLVAMAQPEPVMRAKHSILTHRGDGEACHEKSRGRKNESNRRFLGWEIGVVPTFADCSWMWATSSPAAKSDAGRHSESMLWSGRRARDE